MRLNTLLILKLLNNLWRILAIGLVIYLISQNIVTTRTLVYNLDFNQSITPNITGWYPEPRVDFLDTRLEVRAEPIYLKAYSAIDFNTLTVQGNLKLNDQEIRLGLRQADGSWEFKNIDQESFSLDFDLTTAQKKRNQIELILSIPNLDNITKLYLDNNWQLIFTR